MTNEPTKKTCTRCGKTFTGTIYLCTECDSELEKREGEYGVKFNEPTTGEIVRALREDCSLLDDNTDKFAAADRLESQAKENEISRHLIEMQSNVITELTARAESAERERDAAKADMKLIVDAVRETHCDETCCFACKHDCDMSINGSGEFANECPGFDRYDCFEWRGLPQDGEGV